MNIILKNLDYLNEDKNDEILVIFSFKNFEFSKIFEDDLNSEIKDFIDLKEGNINELILNIRGFFKKVIFVGLGNSEDLKKINLRKTFGKVTRKYTKEKLCIYLDSLVCEKFSAKDIFYEAAYSIIYANYDFMKISSKEQEKKNDCIIVSNLNINEFVYDAVRDVKCVNYARELSNTPSNYMTPEIFAEKAKILADELGVECEILKNKELENLNAGALLGVNKGSSKEAIMLTLKYKGKEGEPYIAFVGKGLTFDSGGYNLKPSASMTGMKFDMCGGASVLAIFEMLVRKKSKLNIMAVIPLTENKIGPDGYTCDDVLISMSGKSIEITNTDAEGRLILCDALTYAQKLGAKKIIDIATLTGACIIALGKNYTGAFSNNREFIRDLMNASKITEEKIWELPLDEEFSEQVRNSNVADITNSVKGGAGSSLGAAFLQEFINDDVEWIHLDIAGSSDIENKTDYCAKGATGAMIRTVVEMFSDK